MTEVPKYPDIVPNATTRAAMAELDDSLPSFANVEDLMAHLSQPEPKAPTP